MLAASSALAYEKLERGDINNDVLAMQKALKSLGYSITCDGNFGSGTLETVKAFQRRYGLEADGVAGTKTLSLLYSLAPSFAPGASSSAGDTSSGSSASGGITATVVTTGGSLNLRFTANSTAKVLTTIPNGAKITVTQQGSSWCAAVYNGYAGYVMTEFLRFSSAAATSTPTPTPNSNAGAGTTATVVTTGGSLNLRAAARDTAKVLTTIPFGAKITVTSRGTTWCAASYAGYSGYVMTQFLSFGDTPLITASPSPTPALPSGATGVTAYVTTTGGSLNLRASAKSNAKVLTTIPNNTALTITQQDATWCATSYNGYSGYVMTSFLRFDSTQPTASPTPTPTLPPAQDGEAAYVTTTGGSLNLRAEARSGAKVLTTIPNNTQLVITQRGTSWCATYYNGYSGYVMTSFLTFPGDKPTATPSPTPTSGTTSYALVTTSGGSLNLRAEASSNAKVLVTIPNAATVLVHSRGTDWCSVTYSGTSGYVMTKFLTFFSSGPTNSPTPDDEENDPSQYKRTLKKGMTGEDVTWVQGRLLELGYTPSSNGTYDDKTIAAVKAFQGQNGLSTDGLAGSQTFAMLRSSNARRADDTPLNYTTLRVDDEGEAVTSMQKALKELGYNVTVNGTFDVATHNAVVAFQQRNGLVISGIADALTRQILHGGSALPYSTPVEELPADAGKMAAPAVSEIKLLHWQNEIKPNVKTGQTFTVYDPNTGLGWDLKFYSLGRHADSQPASWRDTQIMNRSFGSTSWTIHPVYVLLPTGQWTMATMHNRPHLYGSITDNGFGGHLCVHFLRDMDEAMKNDPNYGVNNQKTLRSAWKALTGETVN